MKTWNWLKGGLALGILSIAAVLLAKPLGVTTEYVVIDGMLANLISNDFVKNNLYMSQYAKNMTLSYGLMVVIGMCIGALISVLLGGFRVPKCEKSIPDLWKSTFGEKKYKRYLHAFVGGFLLLFGARMAGGCTSGNIISGISQLSLSGFIFAAGVFLSGIPVAKIMFRNRKEEV